MRSKVGLFLISHVASSTSLDFQSSGTIAIFLFYLHGSVHRKCMLINVQRNERICSLYFILLHYHSTCFGCRPHPSPGAHKTVVAATGTSHMMMQLPHSNAAKLATFEWGSCTIIWLVTVDVTTVLCAPGDECGRHPKHVEWYCSKIKYRLHIFASRWTFILQLSTALDWEVSKCMWSNYYNTNINVVVSICCLNAVNSRKDKPLWV